MAPSQPTTVIVPVNLGAASKYEEDIFPLAYHSVGDAISKGSLLLSATLDEMVKVAEMGIDLNTDKRFRFNARIEYEVLAAREAQLQSRPKSLNPFTMLRHYRAARMFLAASRALFLDTKRTSERIQRDQRLMRAVPSTELHSMRDIIPQGATITGIAVQLPGSLDDDAQKAILAATNAIALRASTSDPFVDNMHVPQLSDDDSIITLADTASLLSHEVPSGDEQERPMGSDSSYNFYFYNSVLAAGSSVRGMTLSHGSGNTGPAAEIHPISYHSPTSTHRREAPF